MCVSIPINGFSCFSNDTWNYYNISVLDIRNVDTILIMVFILEKKGKDL